MLILDQFKKWFEQDKGMRKVADDPQLTAELILLVRMMFADGVLKQEELANFRRICNIAFGIPVEEVPKVVKYLQEYGYETTVEDASAMFHEMGIERKRSLLLHMLSIAKSDSELHEDEQEIIRRTATILGVTAEDIAEARASEN